MYEFSSSSISSLRLKKKRFMRRTGVFALILSVACFSLVYVWQRVQVISTGYKVEALKKERDELLRTNKSLQIEAATLTSPGRISEIARGSIGMKPAEYTQVVLVKKIKRGAGTAPDKNHQAEQAGSTPGRS